MRIPDHYVRLVELPPTVRGLVVPNDDGTFSVYINALFDEATRRRTLEHELEHLARDHFYAPGSIARQEAEASGAAAAKAPGIRLYPSLAALAEYLRGIGALDTPIEQLGRPL